jgi:phage-related protein
MGKTAVLAVRIVSDAKGASAGFDQATRKVGLLERAGGLAKVALAAGATAAIAYGAKAVSAAGDLQQSIGAVDTVFGKSAAQMHKWADSAATDVGLTKNEFNELATLMGTQLANGGTSMKKLGPKTKELIGLGADLSSMFGGSTKDAVGALSSALKGERDPIEKYGVSLKQSSIDAKAAELGYKKVGGSLSNEAQQAATLALIMEQTRKAQGNFSRETDTLAHQQQVAGAQFENLTASIGTMLLPAVTTVMAFFNDQVMPILNQVAGVVGQVAGVVGGALASAWSNLTTPGGQAAGVLSTVSDVMADLGRWATGTLMPALVGLGATLKSAFNRVAPIVVGVITQIRTGMAPALPIVRQIFGTIGSIVTGALDLVGAAVNAVVNTITGIWQAWGPQIVGVLTTWWTAILGVINPVLDTIRAVIATFTAAFRGDWTGVWNGIVAILTGVWNTITGVITGAWNTIRSVFVLAWKIIGDVVSSGVRRLVAWFAGIGSSIGRALAGFGTLLASRGTALINGLKDGITRAWTTVVGWLGGIGERIASSVGSLATRLVSAGRDLINGLWNGIADKVGWIRDQIAGFVGNVEHWFRDFFGIHSPSTLMAGMGRQLSAGLAQGITAGTGLATAAMRGLSEAVQDNVSGVNLDLTATAGPAGRSRSAPVTVNITVNGALDARAVADQLRSIINTDARVRGVVKLGDVVLP